MESSEGDPCKQNMMDVRFDKMDTKWLHGETFSFFIITATIFESGPMPTP